MKTPLELTKEFVERQIVEAISEGKDFTSFCKTDWFFYRNYGAVTYFTPTIPIQTLRLLGIPINYRIVECNPVKESTIHELEKLRVRKKFFGKEEIDPIIDEFIKNIPNMPKWAQLQW